MFNLIGQGLAAAFLAELSLVQGFIENSRVVFGGTFGNLLGFNAVVIPGLAVVVTLVWLAGKGLAGGSSKTSAEDIIKRVLGAFVISFTLSLIVNPIESLIGALDASLMSLVNVNAQGLQHAFAGIVVFGGAPIFVALLIILLGLVLAGLLIAILLIAHAAVFLLVYFAPYFALFRKDGFREMVEGVTAALSMPFIITSILAIGIATMGAAGGAQPQAGAITAIPFTGVVDGHAVAASMSLTAASPSPSLVGYLANAISGLLILGAAVFLPKFLVSMVFQAGTAIHNAFHAGHEQKFRAATGAIGAKAQGAIAARGRIGKRGASANQSSAPVPGAIDKGEILDAALTAAPPPSVSSQAAARAQSRRDIRANAPNGRVSSSSPHGGAEGGGSGPAQPQPDQPVHPQTPPGRWRERFTKEAIAAAMRAAPGKAKAAGIDHYVGTIKAAPRAFSSLAAGVHEDPLHGAARARASWHAAKRQSILNVKEARRQREAAGEAAKEQAGEAPTQPPAAGEGATP